MREIIKACENLGLPFKIIDKNENVVEIKNNNFSYFFIQASGPFNSTATVTLSKDKDFSYQIFGKDLNMPRSKAYLNPFCNEKHQGKAEFRSFELISDDIEKNFSYPVIVKMNRGSLGHNVFRCENKEDVQRAISTIFEQDSQYYDYIALAQDYVKIAHEYRAIWYEGKVLMVYEKIATDKNENLSPLHNESGKAVYIDDATLIERIQKHIDKSDLKSTFEFLGIDVVIDEKDEMFVLELNTRPGFSYFIRDNGEEKLTEMYEKILKWKFSL